MIPDVGPLLAALERLQLSVADLWLDYFALGGRLDAVGLRAYLHGDGRTSLADHDAIVQALNEVFGDRGQDHPLSYAMA
jgi:hypothetical protein